MAQPPSEHEECQRVYSTIIKLTWNRKKYDNYGPLIIREISETIDCDEFKNMEELRSSIKRRMPNTDFKNFKETEREVKTANFIVDFLSYEIIRDMNSVIDFQHRFFNFFSYYDGKLYDTFHKG